NTICAMNVDDITVFFDSGTSLSTPLVAGAATILLQVHPEWSAMDVREALLSAASQHESPDNDFGWGIINTLKASGMITPNIIFQDYNIDDTEGNGNGWIDPGETIKFFFTFLNSGTIEASDISVQLEIKSPYVTLIDSFFSLGVILPDSIITLPQPFTVKIAEQAPTGEVLPVQLTLIYSKNRMLQVTFNLTIAFTQWYVSWSESELISENEYVANTISSCIDNRGDVNVIWSEGRASRTAEAVNIYHTSQSRNGWYEPLLMFSYQLDDFSRVMVRAHILPYLDNLYTMLFFLEWYKQDLTAYFSNWEGTAWSDAVPTLEEYPDWEIDDIYNALAVDGKGRLHVVLRYNKVVEPIFFHCVQDSSGWIRTPIDDYGYYPSMVIDSKGSLHLTYMKDGTSRNNDIFYTYSTNNGLTWATPVEVYASPSYSYFPVIAVDSQDTRHIVWLENGVIPQIIVTGDFFHSFSRDGVYWSSPIIVTDPVDSKSLGREPGLIVDRDGDVHLIWEEGDMLESKWSEIYYAQWLKEGELWSPPVPLTSDIDGISKNRPNLTLDDFGRLHFIFSLTINDSDKTYSIHHMVSEPVCGPMSLVLADTTQNLPSIFQLFQNYPNPFNAQTVIKYKLSRDCKVELVVYNILGQKVRTLINEYQTAGLKHTVWEGQNDSGKSLGSGTYFIRMKTGEYRKVNKILLLR
ncbi:MAG: T9SS type A sorting domain-containing protein, partial [bacterium]